MIQKILPSDYKIHSVDVKIIDNNSDNPLENKKMYRIKDADTIEELANILQDYENVRSFDTTGVIIDEKIIFLTMYLYNYKKSLQLNLMIKENRQRAYTSTNTDFVYLIQNKDTMLDDKVMNLIDKIVKNPIKYSYD